MIASACDVGDPGSVPGSGRSPAEGNGIPLQYSCLENSMDWVCPRSRRVLSRSTLLRLQAAL